MAAAAHFLHDQLHVHFIDGTGADKDLALIPGEHKTCLHALNIQKVIGCLRADDSRTLHILRVADRDREGIPEDLRV